MKILYLMSNRPDDTANKIIEIHKQSNDVSIIDMNANKNYDEIVDAIAESDKVISW